MATTPSQPQVLKFGVFEVDLAAGEVRKAGMRQKLAGQHFQVLQALLERPQEIVTREELRRRLWPDNTYVDYELALKKAVNRLREVLGDSAENPHYIETVPRRGYRFMAPLNGARLPAMSDSPAGAVDSATAPAGVVTTPPNREALYRIRIRLGAIIVGAALAFAAVLAYAWMHRLPPPRIGRFAQITADAQGKSASYVDELPSALVGDGSQLYFMEGPLGDRKLAQVSTEGGETSLFATPLPIRRPLDVSPNRHEVLALKDEGLQLETALMVLPLPAGAPHRLGDVQAHDASWSPDGTRIVYANGHDLYMSKADGSAPRKIAKVTGGTAWWPRWSRDGSLVRFTVLQTSGLHSLWEVSTDGSHLLHPLFSSGNKARDACCGNWTSDGRHYIFQSEGELWATSEGFGLFRKAQEPKQLTTGPLKMVASVTGLDGKQIFAIGVQQRGQLVRYDKKSSHFVPFLSGISADDVDFSSDGQWTTYVAFPEQTLWRSRADGSERLQLTLPPMKVSLPRWSPDGKQIAFTGEGNGKPVKIYIVSADGGTAKQAIPGEGNEGEPSWSPDGNSLAFAPWFWLGGGTGIRSVDLRTGQVTMLPGSEELFSVRWSPTGRHIAAIRADSSQTLVLFDVETRKCVELAKSAAYPNWSRDGRYIYFDNPYTNEPALYRVGISDRKVERLATLDPRVLTWAIAGKWTGLAPDDSPLVLRDNSVEEIYALDWAAP